MSGFDQETYDRAAERRDLALTDLEELTVQVADGEIDYSTAAGLRTDYEAELAAAEAELAKLATAPVSEKPSVSGRSTDLTKPEPSENAQAESQPSGLNKRLLVGAGLFMVALVVILISVQQSSEPDPTATESVLGAPADEDPCSELEAALSDHADNAFRLALADCYMGAGNAMSAIEHYRSVTESDTATTGEASQASVGLGVLNIQIGEFAYAADYMRTALETDPVNLDAQYFLGMLLVYDLDDPAGGVPYLETVLEAPNLSDDVVLGIEKALAFAQVQNP